MSQMFGIDLEVMLALQDYDAQVAELERLVQLARQAREDQARAFDVVVAYEARIDELQRAMRLTREEPRGVDQEA